MNRRLIRSLPKEPAVFANRLTIDRSQLAKNIPVIIFTLFGAKFKQIHARIENSSILFLNKRSIFDRTHKKKQTIE